MSSKFPNLNAFRFLLLLKVLVRSLKSSILSSATFQTGLVGPLMLVVEFELRLFVGSENVTI